MANIGNIILHAIGWVTYYVDKLTTNVTVPVALLLAIFAPNGLRIVVLIGGLAWTVSKIYNAIATRYGL